MDFSSRYMSLSTRSSPTYNPFMNAIGRLLVAILALKSIHIVIFYLLPTQFDILLAILLKKYESEKHVLATAIHTSISPIDRLIERVVRSILDNIVDRFVIWDTVYFADQFTNGLTYEHQYVFCPLWWRLIKLIPVNGKAVFYLNVICATLLSNICHFGAAVVLYYYTYIVFSQARLFPPQKMAELASLFFVLLPGAAFLTAPYSESIAALFSFTCLALREKALEFSMGAKYNTTSRKVLYLLSGVAAALSFGFRANCLLLGLIYIYDLFGRKTETPLLPLAAGLILGLAFLVSNIYNYVAICLSGDRGEWCSNRIPSLFAYAQGHYWNIGLFKYWTLNNIPNFIFGAPTIGLSAFSIKYFAKEYPVSRILPVSLVNAAFLTALLLSWHVQIVTRIHTFLPMMYWVAAGLWTHNDYPILKKVVFGYFIVWNVVQPALFAAFLPPA